MTPCEELRVRAWDSSAHASGRCSQPALASGGTRSTAHGAHQDEQHAGGQRLGLQLAPPLREPRTEAAREPQHVRRRVLPCSPLEDAHVWWRRALCLWPRRCCCRALRQRLLLCGSACGERGGSAELGLQVLALLRETLHVGRRQLLLLRRWRLLRLATGCSPRLLLGLEHARACRLAARRRKQDQVRRVTALLRSQADRSPGRMGAEPVVHLHC